MFTKQFPWKAYVLATLIIWVLAALYGALALPRVCDVQFPRYDRECLS